MPGSERLARDGYLIGAVGGRRYAFATRDVRGVDFQPALTPLPFVPPYVRGIYNRHGELQPVVDLAAFQAGTRCDGGYVVNVAAAGHTVGLLVDAVDEVRAVTEDEARVGPADVAAPLEIVDVAGLLARLAAAIGVATRKG